MDDQTRERIAMTPTRARRALQQLPDGILAELAKRYLPGLVRG